MQTATTSTLRGHHRHRHRLFRYSPRSSPQSKEANVFKRRSRRTLTGTRLLYQSSGQQRRLRETVNGPLSTECPTRMQLQQHQELHMQHQDSYQAPYQQTSTMITSDSTIARTHMSVMTYLDLSITNRYATKRYGLAIQTRAFKESEMSLFMFIHLKARVSSVSRMSHMSQDSI
jgi:hypothetical protein